MVLTNIPFQSVINTSDTNIIDDFYIPMLHNSIRYDRGVGFFSAIWLSITAHGMVEFAKNRGHARWITSPILSESDWEALKHGEEARHDVVIRNALERNIIDLERDLRTDTLSALAWLVADGILDFRLALPRNKLAGGEFHDKFGIFADELGNQVSFSGSNNESLQGTINYESFKVFSSWESTLATFVQDDARRFERLWNNQDPNLQVYTIPDAARAQILKLRTYERPYPEPDILPSIEGSGRNLWKHQEDAILAWEQNGRQGILSMATGSGKTLTALNGALRCKSLELLIIAVPRSNLVTQWASELNQLGGFPEPILVYDDHRKWQEMLFQRLLSHKGKSNGEPIVVIGTMASLSGDAFQSVLKDIGTPENTLLIVDEVHNAGAPSYRKILLQGIQWRLGLSATPTRHFDEIGTHVIDEYFNGTVYWYGLKQALIDKRLTPYLYDVYPAYMSDDEYASYHELTLKIIRLRGAKDNQLTYQTNNQLESDNKDIEKLLFERARIIKKCAEKSTLITEIFSKYPPKRCLVYCADHEQLDAISHILNTQQRVHLQYTSHSSNNERKSVLESLEKGSISVLLAINCLDEGVDIPVVDQAVILASSSNMRQFIQRRGRILRRAKDKTRAVLVDVIVLPPKTVGHDGRHMLLGELARAKEMALLAENDIQVLNKIGDLIQPYGVLFTQLLSGEHYE